MRKSSKNTNITGYIFISPWLIGFFAFTFIPIITSLALAFTRYDILTSPEWIGLANFKRMFFEDRYYWNTLRVTFVYILIAIPCRLTLALLVAMLLNTSHRFIGVYRTAYYIPSLVGGSVAISLLWRQVFAQNGLVNLILALLGIESVNWLGNPRTIMWPLIILSAWQFGAPMLIFLAGLKQIPSKLYESASIDGAGYWAQFVKITIPMLSPVIFFNLVMQFISGFMAFTQSFIIALNGGPLDQGLFYSVYLYQKAFRDFEMGYSAAMAWVLLLIIASFTTILFKSSSDWVYYESKEN